MSENSEIKNDKPRSLRAALAIAKDQAADRADVVVDLQVAEVGRLELLADELRPIVEELDPADDRFEFALSQGQRPRLWIDMTSFVSMGADKRTYRLLKDTRMGRIVMAESGEIKKMADLISQYTAEKVLERQQILEGERIPIQRLGSATKPDSEGIAETKAKKKRGFWSSFGWFVFGVLCTLAALLGAAFVLAPDAFQGLI